MSPSFCNSFANIPSLLATKRIIFLFVLKKLSNSVLLLIIFCFASCSFWSLFCTAVSLSSFSFCAASLQNFRSSLDLQSNPSRLFRMLFVFFFCLLSLSCFLSSSFSCFNFCRESRALARISYLTLADNKSR